MSASRLNYSTPKGELNSAKLALLVVANVPFALVGGIAALLARHMNLNLSASIGFIALFGVAMLNGVVLASSIRQLSESGIVFHDAVLAGSSVALRESLLSLRENVVVEGTLHDQEWHLCDSLVPVEDLLRIAFVDRLPGDEERRVVLYPSRCASASPHSGNES